MMLASSSVLERINHDSKELSSVKHRKQKTLGNMLACFTDTKSVLKRENIRSFVGGKSASTSERRPHSLYHADPRGNM